jgi:hypothetical protein
VASRRSVVRGAPFGEEQWQEATAAALGLESALGGPGRPKGGKWNSLGNLTRPLLFLLLFLDNSVISGKCISLFWAWAQIAG